MVRGSVRPSSADGPQSNERLAFPSTLPQLTVNVPHATWRHEEQLYSNKGQINDRVWPPDFSHNKSFVSVSPQLCFLPNCLQTLEIQRVNTQTYKRFSTQKYDESQAGRRFLLAQVNAMI